MNKPVSFSCRLNWLDLMLLLFSQKLVLLICVFVILMKMSSSNPVGFSTGPIGYSTGPIGYSTGPIGNSFSYGRSYGGGIGSAGGFGMVNGVPFGGLSIVPFFG